MASTDTQVDISSILRMIVMPTSSINRYEGRRGDDSIKMIAAHTSDMDYGAAC